MRDTFNEGGVELLEKRPPDPLPHGAFALPTPRRIRIPCLIFTPHGVEQQFFTTTFSSLMPHAFITVPHPTSQFRASTSPQSTM